MRLGEYCTQSSDLLFSLAFFLHLSQRQFNIEQQSLQIFLLVLVPRESIAFSLFRPMLQRTSWLTGSSLFAS
jgi:hypothetical protein